MSNKQDNQVHLTETGRKPEKNSARSKKLMSLAFIAITVSWNYQLVNKNISL